MANQVLDLKLQLEDAQRYGAEKSQALSELEARSMTILCVPKRSRLAERGYHVTYVIVREASVKIKYHA